MLILKTIGFSVAVMALLLIIVGLTYRLICKSKTKKKDKKTKINPDF